MRCAFIMAIYLNQFEIIEWVIFFWMFALISNCVRKRNYHNCIRYRISSYNKYQVTSIFLCYFGLHKCLNYLIRFCVLTIKLYKAFILPVTVVEIVQCSMDHYCLHTKKVKKFLHFLFCFLWLCSHSLNMKCSWELQEGSRFISSTILALKGS